jgi:hypothetical protein
LFYDSEAATERTLTPPRPIVEESAATRASDVTIRKQLDELAGFVYLLSCGELEQLYSARPAGDYDALKADLRERFDVVVPLPTSSTERSASSVIPPSNMELGTAPPRRKATKAGGRHGRNASPTPISCASASADSPQRPDSLLPWS